MRLNSFLKQKLKELAIVEINEELSKTKFYDEVLKYKTYLEGEVTKFLEESFKEEDVKCYVNIVKMFGYTKIFHKEDEISIMTFDVAQYSSTYEIRKSFEKFNKLKLTKKVLLPIDNLVRIQTYDHKIRKDLIIYNMMLHDIGCFIKHEICPYELLINKKTTLNALSKVWPGCLKLDKKILQKNKGINQKTCDIMTEDEAIKKIQNKNRRNK